VHFSGNTDCGLSCFRICVVCFVLVGELAWILMCTLLVTQPVACLVSGCELAWFFMWTLLVMQMWPILFQMVRCELAWFLMYSTGDTECGLTCFRM
ncbi:hypothetical protein K443DRAFT_109459, partial [Laccaria amethystina LaAM-08-1]